MAVVVVQGGYRGDTDKHDVQQHSGASGEERHSAEGLGGGRHRPIIECSQSSEGSTSCTQTVALLVLPIRGGQAGAFVESDPSTARQSEWVGALRNFPPSWATRRAACAHADF